MSQRSATPSHQHNISGRVYKRSKSSWGCGREVVSNSDLSVFFWPNCVFDPSAVLSARTSHPKAVWQKPVSDPGDFCLFTSRGQLALSRKHSG